MDEKALALRLADALVADRWHPRYREHAAAELRRLHAENESLKRTLAESCDEERSQMWESGGGGGCARALSAEFKCAELLEALQDLCDTLGECGMTEKARAAIARAEGEKG